MNYDYDLFDEKLAHDFKVKPVETEFIKLEEKMRRVANELAAMVQNEAAMRSVNGIRTFQLLIMCRIDIYKSLEILGVVHFDTCWLVHLRVLLLETILPNQEAHLKCLSPSPQVKSFAME